MRRDAKRCPGIHSAVSRWRLGAIYEQFSVQGTGVTAGAGVSLVAMLGAGVFTSFRVAVDLLGFLAPGLQAEVPYLPQRVSELPRAF